MSQCSYEGCEREIYSDHKFPITGKCIFHADADKKDPQAFRDALAKQIRQWRRTKANVWDFSDVAFADIERKDKRGISFFNLFRRAVFPVDVVFDKATFSRAAEFSGAIFSGDARFERMTFKGDALFEKVIFSGFTQFETALFSGAAKFAGATFSKYAGFKRATFSGNAAFSAATFSGNAQFPEVIFSGEVWFVKTIFSEYAGFSEATFSEYAEFSGAIFSSDAVFFGATFSREALFQKATFSEEFDLSYVSFAILGDFIKCHISGRVTLTWPGEGMKRDKEQQEVERGTLQFKDLIFEKTAFLTFVITACRRIPS